ncbi:hypothetical protein [Burkholderia gladioli]|uniref:hypothetical protein n=1 Tax=Burkholderia gladioli TaxID=28095 RepID=UPI00163FB625|nr:hypothetical protein [Burkholderia gladioli]
MHFESLDPYQQDELALSEVKAALAQRGLDGPQIGILSRETIKYLEVCYPEASALEIHKSVWFVAEVIDLTTGTTDLSKLTDFLEGRKASFLDMYFKGISALDIFALKAYMEIWSELYAVPMSQAYQRLRERSDASERAQQRHQSSPQAEAKAAVKSCWEDWQTDRGRYRGNAAFARDMLAKHEGTLTSTKVIERWCTEWTRQKSATLSSPKNTHRAS